MVKTEKQNLHEDLKAFSATFLTIKEGKTPLLKELAALHVGQSLDTITGSDIRLVQKTAHSFNGLYDGFTLTFQKEGAHIDIKFQIQKRDPRNLSRNYNDFIPRSDEDVLRIFYLISIN